MADIQGRIRARVEAFVEELSSLMEQAANAAVVDAVKRELGELRRVAGLGGGARGGRRGARGAGAGAGAGAGSRAGARRAGKATGRGGRGGGGRAKSGTRAPGEKRAPEEIAALVERVHQYVTENPGVGIEKIGKDLDRPTSELSLPVKKLLADKRIRRKGEKRATKYFPREAAAAS